MTFHVRWGLSMWVCLCDRRRVRWDRDTWCSPQCKWRGHEDKGKCQSNIVCLCGLRQLTAWHFFADCFNWLEVLSYKPAVVACLCGLLRLSWRSVGKETCHNTIVFRKCLLQLSYVFADCFNWLEVLSAGRRLTNFWQNATYSRRMSLRAASTELKRCRQGDIGKGVWCTRCLV